jgi:hypothetical protein
MQAYEFPFEQPLHHDDSPEVAWLYDCLHVSSRASSVRLQRKCLRNRQHQYLQVRPWAVLGAEIRTEKKEKKDSFLMT